MLQIKKTALGKVATGVLERALALVLALSAGAKAEPGAPLNNDASGTSDVGNLKFSVSWAAPKRVVVPMRMRYGLPTVPCSINGHGVWLILDTGSQACVLEAATAREVGVHVINQPSAQVEVAGARGREIDHLGIPENVSIGDWHWQGLPFVIRTSPQAVSRGSSGRAIAFNIVGMSAFEPMCSYVTLDYRHHEVVFGFKQTFRPASSAAFHQPFELHHGSPSVKVTHGSQEWNALLDTGASSKFEINRASADQLGLRAHVRWVSASYVGLGDPQRPANQKWEFLDLANINCLGHRWKSIEALAVDDESKIGSGMCQALRLTVDLAGSQIWIEGGGAVGE